jgi:hypothetical protein
VYISATGAKPVECLGPGVRAKAQIALEAAKARAFGKSFVAAILEGLLRTLWHAPRVVRVIEQWPGDLASAGVIFRLNSGLHALARSGRYPQLQSLYRMATQETVPDPIELDPTLALALADGEDELLLWLTGPTQTNEVARVAGLAAVLAELSADDPLSCSLIELGASAGLNLNLARYDVHMGGHRVGDAASEIRIAPRWAGSSPRPGPLLINRAVGVDINPINVARPADAERLLAYIWPGEHARTERLRAAIALARRYRPMVEQGHAGNWLERQLAAPQASRERRVVFHSMVLQYLPLAEQQQIDRLMADAGERASKEQPLVRVGLEWNDNRSSVELGVTLWNGGPGSGRTILAARCHPYAEWIEWLGTGADVTP